MRYIITVAIKVTKLLAQFVILDHNDKIVQA